MIGSRSSLPVRALAAAIAMSLAVGVGAVAMEAFDDTGPKHPDAWDPRVADLADFVAGARGLEFDHPVQVDFLTPEEYSTASTRAASDITEDELAELESGMDQLRALGVASGSLDLVATLNQVTDAGTLAFYAPADQRVSVRGTELTVGLRVTIVHELTHALQDQHFDVQDLLRDELDSSEATARRALLEGDAIRIENQFVAEGLTDEERARYEEEYAGQVAASKEATADVPPFLQASFAVPYALGAPFVRMLVADGGNDAVDRAFERPPSTEEHLFDPVSYLAGEGDDPPDLGLDDVELSDEGPFGSPTWFLVLAERIDPQQALAAALGWGGDRYGVFDRDGTTCIRAVFRGDTDTDEVEMAAALSEWAAAMPGGLAQVVEVDGRPGLEACDPGGDVDLQVSGRSLEVLVLPASRGHLVAEVVADLGPAGARCFATRVLDGVPYEQLSDPDGEGALSEELGRRAARAYLECGSGDR